MRLLWQAYHRRKPGRPDMTYTDYFSNVINRIRRSRQAATVPAGMLPVKAGTPGIALLYQPDQAVLAGGQSPGRHATG
jgi:hypothetical protein